MKWPLAIGLWLLAFGYWPLAIGLWPLALYRFFKINHYCCHRDFHLPNDQITHLPIPYFCLLRVSVPGAPGEPDFGLLGWLAPW